MSLDLDITKSISIELLEEHVKWLVSNCLLQKEEATTVISTVRFNDLTLSRNPRDVNLYRQAIEFESGLVNLLSQRRQSKSLPLKDRLLHAESYFKRRVGEYYINVLQFNPDNVDMRLECIQFLTCFQHEVDMFKRVLPEFNTRSLEKMGNAPDIVRIVAAWYNINGSQGKVRDVLFNGLTQNPQNISLYLDVLEFELGNNGSSGKITHLKRCIDLMVRHLSNRCLQETIILLDKSEGVEEVAKYTVEKYEEHFKDNVETWLFLVARELKGSFKAYGPKEKFNITVAAVRRAVDKFKLGIAKLPSKTEPELWQAYLSFMVIQKTKNPDPEIIKLTRNAFESAYNTKNVILTEQHYFVWLDCYEDRSEFQEYRFKYAVEKDPTSELLWCLYLSNMLQTPNNLDKAYKVLGDATKAVGSDAVKLYDLYIKACMLNSKNRTMMIFEEALRHSDITASHFKPVYFSYVLVSFGLQPARDCYKTISKTRPFSKQLHKEMLEAERLKQFCDGKPSSKIAEVLELWTQQFGHSDLEVYRVHMEWVLEKATINANNQEELNGFYRTIQKELKHSLSEIYGAALERIPTHDEALRNELRSIYEEVRAKVLDY